MRRDKGACPLVTPIESLAAGPGLLLRLLVGAGIVGADRADVEAVLVDPNAFEILHLTLGVDEADIAGKRIGGLLDGGLDGIAEVGEVDGVGFLNGFVAKVDDVVQGLGGFVDFYAEIVIVELVVDLLAIGGYRFGVYGRPFGEVGLVAVRVADGGGRTGRVITGLELD